MIAVVSQPLRDRFPRLIQGLLGGFERLASLGVVPADGDDARTQKATLTIAASLVSVLATVWVLTYLALGLPQAATIPFGYQVASVASLVVFARSKDYGLFRFTQVGLMLVLPFLLQWTLGGYDASSAVSLWALVAAFSALFFYGSRRAVPWFVGFLLLTLGSGLVDPVLSQRPASIPAPVHVVFFVLNVSGVSLTAYLLLQYFVRAREAAHQRSERLLLNVLPGPIAERLKRNEGIIAESHDEVTVLFADVVDFTPFVERTPPQRVVGVLDAIFTAFDGLAVRHGLEKIKTIGDAYMVVAGLPAPRRDHAAAAAAMALDMQAELKDVCQSLGLPLSIRIGMHSGPVVAGVIGRSKFIYDLWGDTVNTASRMEALSLPGRIQVTDSTYERLRAAYEFEDRGEIEVKGKGRLRAYLLVGRRAAPAS